MPETVLPWNPFRLNDRLPLDFMHILVDPVDARIIDDHPAADTEHPLVNGVVVKAPKLKVTNIKTTVLSGSLTATIIAADEGGMYPGTPGVPVKKTIDGVVYAVWSFTWNNLPGLGCGATLRFKEVVSTGRGATVNLTIHVAEDMETFDPCGPDAA